MTDNQTPEARDYVGGVEQMIQATITGSGQWWWDQTDLDDANALLRVAVQTAANAIGAVDHSPAGYADTQLQSVALIASSMQTSPCPDLAELMPNSMAEADQVVRTLARFAALYLTQAADGDAEKVASELKRLRDAIASGIADGESNVNEGDDDE